MAPGDIVVRLGEREINEPDDLVGATLALEPGTKVTAEILREGRRDTLEVVLGRRPPLQRPGR
jgi:S1-C subfamily serine protease